ncbi:MAG: deoxyhypusine synthase family protein [Planctomycetota bacterium]
MTDRSRAAVLPATSPAPPSPAEPRPAFLPGTGQLRAFLEHHFLHFNSRETLDAAKAYEAHLDAGGKMMVTLAGAMSTARIGRTLSRMIREDKVHAICCTGANLEEDLFTLLSADRYEHCPNWRALSAEDEQALYERGLNRVTDTCIPEDVMRHVENRLRGIWERTLATEERFFPHEFLFEVLDQPDLAEHFSISPKESWLVAAKDQQIPIYTPGWEDSTLGNIFTAWAMQANVFNHTCLRTGTEQLAHLARWYRKQTTEQEESNEQSLPGVGFFQIGGGIAGDFPICDVPMMIQDLKWTDTPYWSYFCQISDADTSYGGYSGAVPNEKITWGKLDVDTPKFMIASDATIVAPLIFGYVLGD